MKNHIVKLLLVLLTLASCHSSKKATTNPTQKRDISSFTDTRWQLSPIEEDNLDSSINKTQIHFTANSSDSTIVGVSGSSAFYGKYKIEEEGDISFSNISTSNMSLKEKKDEDERFLKELETTTHFSVKGDKLTLINKDEKRLQFAKVINYTNPIEGKYWKLLSLNKKSVSMVENQEREIFFRLKIDENRVIGFSGCNHFQGTYTLKEFNKIKFNTLSATKMACPGLSIKESQVLMIFELADSYLLVDDFLLIRTKDGQPLAEFEAIYF